MGGGEEMHLSPKHSSFPPEKFWLVINIEVTTNLILTLHMSMLGVRVCIAWSTHVHVHLPGLSLHIITKYGVFQPHPVLIILPQKLFPKQNSEMLT